MPRGVLVRPKGDMEAIRLFHDYHIDSFRRSKQTGRILAIDHVSFGWMSPERYYQLQKIDQIRPLLEKILEGGYRAKAALWSTTASVHVLGTGLAVPVGIGVILGALGAYAFHNAVGKQAEAILDLLSIFLPFGEVWLFYSGAVTFVEGAGGFQQETVLDVVTGEQVPIEDPKKILADVGGWIWDALNFLRGA